MVRPLGTLVDLVNRKIGQVSSKSGKIYGRRFMPTFFDILQNLAGET